MTLTQILVTLAGGGLLGYFLKYYLDLKFSKESEIHAKKRKVYEDLVSAMQIFIKGRNITPELKSNLFQVIQGCGFGHLIRLSMKHFTCSIFSLNKRIKTPRLLSK